MLNIVWPFAPQQLQLNVRSLPSSCDDTAVLERKVVLVPDVYTSSSIPFTPHFSLILFMCALPLFVIYIHTLNVLGPCLPSAIEETTKTLTTSLPSLCPHLYIRSPRGGGPYSESLADANKCWSLRGSVQIHLGVLCCCIFFLCSRSLLPYILEMVLCRIYISDNVGVIPPLPKLKVYL